MTSRRSAGAALTVLAVALALALVVVGPARAAAAGPTSPGDPIGRLDVVTPGPGTGSAAAATVVEGWAADPDAPGQPVAVRIYLDGAFARDIPTGHPRDDVAAAFPWAGPDAGFSGYVPGTARQSVCAYAINVGAGTQNTTLGCSTAPTGNPDAGVPEGSLDVLTARAGAARVAGWAADPDEPATALSVVASVDGTPIAVLPAARPRPDVTAGFPQYTSDHGFDTVVPVLPGPHRLCVTAANIGPNGTHAAELGCADLGVAGVTPPGPHDPRGALDTVQPTFAGTGYEVVGLAGWAFDPDGPGPWSVIVRAAEYDSRPFSLAAWPVSEVGAGTGIARPDVLVGFPPAGPSSGWSASVSWPSKYVVPRYVCAYAAGVGAGANEVLLGCRTP